MCLFFSFRCCSRYRRVQQTSFYSDLLKSMQIVPLLGSSFAVYAPVITVIIGAFTLFDGCGRILKMMGIDHEDAVSTGLCCWKKLDSHDEEKMEEGKKLVAGQMSLIAPSQIEAGTSGIGVTVVDTNAAVRALNSNPSFRSSGQDQSMTSRRDETLADDTKYSRREQAAVVSPLFEGRTSDTKFESARPNTDKTSKSFPSLVDGNKSTTRITQSETLPAAATASAGKTYGGRYARLDLDSSSSTEASSPVVNNTLLPLSSARVDAQKTDLFSSSATSTGKVYGGRYS